MINKFIVGLGNPDAKYQATRHNTGFMVADAMAHQAGAAWQVNKKWNAQIAALDNALLIKPLTYMNDSGRAVRAALALYQALPKLGWLHKKNADLADILLLIHDDIDIKLGSYKLQANRSAAGHRGVQSVIDQLKTQNFSRLRIGIKPNKPTPNYSTDKFVLENFSGAETKIIPSLLPDLLTHIAHWLSK